MSEYKKPEAPGTISGDGSPLIDTWITIRVAEYNQLRAEVARLTMLFDTSQTETNQFNDGYAAARAGKSIDDQPYYEVDQDSFRPGYAWGKFDELTAENTTLRNCNTTLEADRTQLIAENDRMKKILKTLDAKLFNTSQLVSRALKGDSQ